MPLSAGPLSLLTSFSRVLLFVVVALLCFLFRFGRFFPVPAPLPFFLLRFLLLTWPSDLPTCGRLCGPASGVALLSLPLFGSCWFPLALALLPCVPPVPDPWPRLFPFLACSVSPCYSRMLWPLGARQSLYTAQAGVMADLRRVPGLRLLIVPF